MRSVLVCDGANEAGGVVEKMSMRLAERRARADLLPARHWQLYSLLE